MDSELEIFDASLGFRFNYIVNDGDAVEYIGKLTINDHTYFFCHKLIFPSSSLGQYTLPEWLNDKRKLFKSPSGVM